MKTTPKDTLQARLARLHAATQLTKPGPENVEPIGEWIQLSGETPAHDGHAFTLSLSPDLEWLTMRHQGAAKLGAQDTFDFLQDMGAPPAALDRFSASGAQLKPALISSWLSLYQLQMAYGWRLEGAFPLAQTMPWVPKGEAKEMLSGWAKTNGVEEVRVLEVSALESSQHATLILPLPDPELATSAFAAFGLNLPSALVEVHRSLTLSLHLTIAGDQVVEIGLHADNPTLRQAHLLPSLTEATTQNLSRVMSTLHLETPSATLWRVGDQLPQLLFEFESPL